MRSLIFVAAALSFLAACSDEADIIVPAGRTPEELAEQVAQSYNEMNLELFDDCLSRGFTFHVLNEQSPPVIPDSQWYYADEIGCTGNMFSEAYAIELEMSIGTASPWQQDTTMVMVPCSFSLKVYTSPQDGYAAAGVALLVAREDSEGVWVLEHWFDWSEVLLKERTTWSMIKYRYMRR